MITVCKKTHDCSESGLKNWYEHILIFVGNKAVVSLCLARLLVATLEKYFKINAYYVFLIFLNYGKARSKVNELDEHVGVNGCTIIPLTIIEVFAVMLYLTSPRSNYYTRSVWLAAETKLWTLLSQVPVTVFANRFTVETLWTIFSILKLVSDRDL